MAPFEVDSKTSLEISESDEFLPSYASHSPTRSNKKAQRRTVLLTFANIAILFVSTILFGLSFHSSYYLQHNIGNSLIKTIDYFSPFHDILPINFVELQVNGSLLNMHDSIYRKPPSPEVDAAWHRIGNLIPHVISSEDVIKLGKDPSKSAKFTEDWGFGPDAHVAELDILHTIHCLDAIRRDIHWQYYFSDRYPDGNFPELHRVHTDHCIYIVLQNLMCGATADVVTTAWVSGQLHPFPDFAVNKKCRNFDAIVDWHEENQVLDFDKYAALRKPDEVVPYMMSEEFYRMFGVNEEDMFHANHEAHGGHGGY